MGKQKILLTVFILCGMLLMISSCRSKRNPKYNPKKCRTCPSFSAVSDVRATMVYYA